MTERIGIRTIVAPSALVGNFVTNERSPKKAYEDNTMKSSAPVPTTTNSAYNVVMLMLVHGF